MSVLTRKAVFAAVKERFTDSKARAALTQKLGKRWTHASTEAIAQAIGMQSAPKTRGNNRAKATAKRYGVAKSYAAEQAAARVAGEDKKIAAKHRILRAVNRELKAAEKQAGRKLTQDEKRKVAVKALKSEVEAIKAGKPENKPERGKGENKYLPKDYKKALEALIANDGGPRIDVEQKLKPENLKTAEDRAAYADQEAAHQRSLGNHSGAKAWEDQAKEHRRAALQRDLQAQKQTQTSLFGVTDHASDMPLFSLETPAAAPKAETPKAADKPASGRGSTLPEKASGLHEISPHDLEFDPKRFQYKMVHGETGASGSLTDVGKWDENLGGVLQVWRDPKDGKDYVVNGHNRLNLAKKLGAERVAVRYLQVDTPQEARAIGALTNIAEGRGNAMDAAKFFRDSGITRADLEKKGIPMKEKIATDGLALSQLAPHLFDKVVQGEIPQERAAIIGHHLHDHEAQSKLHELVEREQKKGRKITNDVVRELAQTVQSAPTHSETQFSLFGAEETSRNLALEKADLQATVRQRLSREKKLFGVVAKSKAAEDLAKAGNVIDQGRSKDVSEQAGQVLNIFDQLKNQAGPVSSAINHAAQRIANGEDKKKVTDDLHKQLIEEIPQALGIRKEQRSEGMPSPSTGGTTTPPTLAELERSTGIPKAKLAAAARAMKARRGAA